MRLFLNVFILVILILSANLAQAETNNLQGLEQQISDSVISTKITAKFTKTVDLNPLKIFVSTQNGIVTLKGHVNNKQAFIEALKLVKATRGVKGIEANELIIKPVNTALTDAYITAKVEAAVLTAKVLDDESIPLVGINASTSNGTVTLSGKVEQEKSIIAIIKRVNAVRGVKKIISNLEVSKSILGGD